MQSGLPGDEQLTQPPAPGSPSHPISRPKQAAQTEQEKSQGHAQRSDLVHHPALPSGLQDAPGATKRPHCPIPLYNHLS